MQGWDGIVEARIAQAQAAGAFDDLPGAGKPLDLDDDRLVPEDVRLAFRILKNAGYVPAELVERREAADLRCRISRTVDAPQRRHLLTRLALVEARLDLARASRQGHMPGSGRLSLKLR